MFLSFHTEILMKIYHSEVQDNIIYVEVHMNLS